MKEFIGLFLLIAMMYGVTHFCGVAFRGLKQLAGIAAARWLGQPLAAAKGVAVSETAILQTDRFGRPEAEGKELEQKGAKQ